MNKNILGRRNPRENSSLIWEEKNTWSKAINLIFLSVKINNSLIKLYMFIHWHKVHYYFSKGMSKFYKIKKTFIFKRLHQSRKQENKCKGDQNRHRLWPVIEEHREGSGNTVNRHFEWGDAATLACFPLFSLFYIFNLCKQVRCVYPGEGGAAEAVRCSVTTWWQWRWG